MADANANPWKGFLSSVGLGLVAIAAGIYLYWDLANWEREGGTRLMNSLISLIYHLMGKTGVLVTCELAGIVLITVGVLNHRKQSKQRQIPHENATLR